MGALIDKLNTADRIVELSRQGAIPPILVIDRLLDLGFYDVEIAHPGFVAIHEGVKYKFQYGRPLIGLAEGR